MASIVFSKDKSQLNIDFIHSYLTQSYWAKGRTKEEVQFTIDNSICFGMYLEGEQIGFARVITDKLVFAYLMDVFIDDKYQGKGYGHQLMQAVLNDEELKNVKRWLLITLDAQEFYAKSGFHKLEHPERVMGLKTR